jgi:hypothetical protein
MLLGSPLSAKRAIARNGSKDWLGFAFLAARGANPPVSYLPPWLAIDSPKARFSEGKPHDLY